MKKFELHSPFSPAGDQPKAISQICNNLKNNVPHQVLLGVTGSGKTLTMAHVIAQLNRPTLVLAPNKTLAAQLFVEFREFFPKNAIEYFVSYYDYYQPEAYLPATNTYIAKDASINERIDFMRHSATQSLLERNDVLIVSSVSCIYGLGSPEHYEELVITLEKNQSLTREQLIKDLTEIQYQRNDIDFHRGSFRVRGEMVEIFPAYEEDYTIRVDFFGDYVDRIDIFDSLKGKSIKEKLLVNIYPASHYVSTKERMKKAINSIREELQQYLQVLEKENKIEERKRLEQRTSYDLEILSEMGTCPGVENYSRHLTNRKSGESPPTLLEYFSKNFLTFIDESHITVPQLGGMYRGDRSRKMNLVEHGFRLPSALDNRPLNFEEFQKNTKQIVYVSATPGKYEKTLQFPTVEQIIRPTGLIDPQIVVRPVSHQVDNLLEEIKKRIKKKEKVLVTTLTKKQAEDLTTYYQGLKIKTKYLHSDIKTLERTEIIQDLRKGVFDVLVGINLLREGLDLPEVSLVAILDADREGFLRSSGALIQTMGRAARHLNGTVILYADKETDSIKIAVKETLRRRKLQQKFNKDHNIKPKSIKTSLKKGLAEIYGFKAPSIPISSPKEIQKKIQKLKEQMQRSADNLDFEEAARLRDHIKGFQLYELDHK